jgi:predicted RNA methylase
MPTTLSPEVESVLRASTIKGNLLHLPDQLARPLYESVAKVIKLAGGKWNKSAKAHVFQSDPSAILGLAVESGKITSVQQERQSFYTPKELAEYLVSKADLRKCTVLEPSAGGGALISAALQAGAFSVTAIEKDSAACAELNERFKFVQINNVVVEKADFLTVVPAPNFDRVIMNPPFTRGTWLKHVRHARKFLSAGGTLVAIVPAVEVPADLNAIVLPLPDNSFKSEGTKVRVQLIIMQPA